MVSLALNDIQGNILQGYRFPTAVYLFFTVPDADAGRRFLGELVDDVTSARHWDPPGPPTTTNVALTFAGLRALEVPADVLDALPAAFREPVADRARRVLDDTGESDPQRWDPGLGTGEAHFLVVVGGNKDSVGPFADAVDRVDEKAQRHGLVLAATLQDAATLPNQREHFGWADGYGQPSVEGVGWSRPGQGVPQDDGVTWRDLKAGEFVLGYPDEDGQVVSGPAAALLRNGSYMVYRKLHQDVALFRRELREEAARYAANVHLEPVLDEEQVYELLAAKVVGRWRDGAALKLHPRRSPAESRGLGDRAQNSPDNDFRYWDGDRDGLICPKGAHIRRTNPRDALDPRALMTRRHRILRRGMPYGDPLEGPEDDGRDRGLLFVCFNADLARQFEFVQAQWCNDGNAFRLGTDQDYVLGHGRGSRKVTIEGRPPHFVRAQPLVVQTRGCEYLLMPGIGVLRELAAGGVAPPRAAFAVAQEAAPAGEHAAVDRILAIAERRYHTAYRHVRPALRDAHSKAHGCVRAELEVAADLPAELRHGLFAEPRTYPAWVRFSSSSFHPQPDFKRDAHGMAIKVMGVVGEKILRAERAATTQDFVLANNPVFFCRNAADYSVFLRWMAKDRPLRFFFGPDPRRWRLHEFVNAFMASQKYVANPLQVRYWSQTPSALGPHVVKYCARPRVRRRYRRAVSDGKDFIADTMAAQLSSADATFDFLVQLRTDATTMPVEDPTVRWNERVSPFRPVATLRIPVQEFTDKARRDFAEGLSFTPWHSLPEHRPLGGINRVRRAVYDTISTLRHRENGAGLREPTPDDEG